MLLGQVIRLHYNVIAEYFLNNFKLSFSEKDSPKRAQEEAAYVKLVDFLEKCEGQYAIVMTESRA